MIKYECQTEFVSYEIIRKVINQGTIISEEDYNKLPESDKSKFKVWDANLWMNKQDENN